MIDNERQASADILSKLLEQLSREEVPEQLRVSVSHDLWMEECDLENQKVDLLIQKVLQYYAYDISTKVDKRQRS